MTDRVSFCALLFGTVMLLGAVRSSEGAERESGYAATENAITYEDLIGIVDIGASGEEDFNGVGLSPDKKLVAVEARRAELGLNRTDIRWLIVSVDGSRPPVDAGDGGEPISFTNRGLINGYSPPQVPRWSPDSNWFGYRAKFGGIVQLWRSRRDGAIQERIGANAGDVGEFRWSSDGERIYFQVDSKASRTGRMEADRGLRYDARFAPLYGRGANLADESGAAGEGAIRTYDFKLKEERDATEVERAEFHAMASGVLPTRPNATWVRRASSAAAVTWLEDVRGDRKTGLHPKRVVMAAKTSDGSHAVECEASACVGSTFKGLWIDRGGEFVYFLRWRGKRNYGKVSLYKWRVGEKEPIELLQTDDLIEACAYMPSRLICTREQATVPRTLVAIALESGAMRTIFDPNPEFSKRRFGEVVPLTWTDSDGNEGFGHLVKPVDYIAGHHYPLIIVQYHSRGFLRGGTGDEYPIHVFASKGFAVLSFERPRDWHIEETAQSYDEADVENWRNLHDRQMVFSVLSAGIRVLENIGIVDPKRVGITGLSDGANTADYAIVHSSEMFSAAAVSWTHWNPMNYYLQGPVMQSLLDKWGLGFPGELANMEQWKGLSIALNADRIHTPLLIQVSDSEMLPETETYAAMRHYDRAVDMYIFQDEHHIKVQPRHRYNIYRRNVQWMEFWLQGVEDPEPVSPDQYLVWRALKDQGSRAARPPVAYDGR